MQFPSTEWFEAVRTAYEADELTARRLGWCDSKVRLDVRDDASTSSFLLAFEDYGLGEVRALDAGSDESVDFSLSADQAVWQEMLENIASNGGADGDHTLNHLQLPGIIQLGAEDQGQADMFYRFNQTFQEFFNKSAGISTEFAAAVG
jgi:hypothetical protein